MNHGQMHDEPICDNPNPMWKHDVERRVMVWG